jgi:hypothetical protein
VKTADELAAQLPDPDDWFRLAFVLAAAIPDDRSWTALTAWAQIRPHDRPALDLVDEGEVIAPPAGQRTGTRPASALKPCGTTAAARRHRYRGEPVDAACQRAEQARDRTRKQAARAAA